MFSFQKHNESTGIILSNDSLLSLLPSFIKINSASMILSLVEFFIFQGTPTDHYLEEKVVVGNTVGVRKDGGEFVGVGCEGRECYGIIGLLVNY